MRGWFGSGIGFGFAWFGPGPRTGLALASLELGSRGLGQESELDVLRPASICFQYC